MSEKQEEAFGNTYTNEKGHALLKKTHCCPHVLLLQSISGTYKHCKINNRKQGKVGFRHMQPVSDW